MPIEVHNPTFGLRSKGGAKQRVAFPHPQDGETLRVALIDNEKPNTTRLLDLVAEGIGARYPVETKHILKGGAAFPAPDHVILEASSDTDLVVLATAD